VLIVHYLKCGHSIEVAHGEFVVVHVSGTEVHLLYIVMCCWRMKSATESSYTGTELVYTSTSVIAELRKMLFFKYLCLHDIVELFVKGVFGLQEIHNSCYNLFFLNILQWAALKICLVCFGPNIKYRLG
jgi:hypothetical protein